MSRDHEYLLGTTTEDSRPLAQVLAEAEASGASGAEIESLEQQWTRDHVMCTFNQGGSLLRELLGGITADLLLCLSGREGFE